MSHKTGKRVLATTATSALAFAGLIAMPLTAQAAAADVKLTNLCGGAGIDFVTLPSGTGTYTFKSAGTADGDDVTVTTAGTGAPTVTGTNTGGSPLAATRSTDFKTVKVVLSTNAYKADANGNLLANRLFAVYDEAGTKAELPTFDGVTCGIASVPAPVPNTASKSITVTKGDGIDWNVTAAAGTTFSTDGPAVTGSRLNWPAGSTPQSTQTLTINGTGLVTVTPAVASGYTGVMPAPFTYTLDNLVQVNVVQPVVNDRDGRSSDTVTLPSIPGVSYVYTTMTTPSPLTSAITNASQAASATSANATPGDPSTGWVGASGSITRPSALAEDAPMTIMAIASSTHKFDSSGTQAKTLNAVAFKDDITIKSLPAPTMVNGDGANDYYVLPVVEGVRWEVFNSSSAVTPIAQYGANDGRLGQQIPVYANPGDTYTFKAFADGVNDYVFDSTVTKMTWTAVFDARTSASPVGPVWSDQTGVVNDTITFPAAQSGLTGYLFTVTTGAAIPAAPSVSTSGSTIGQVNANSWKYVDASWYGQTVKLTDLQKLVNASADPMTFTHVWVWTEANQTTALLSKDANGNPVQHQWDYNFTNATVVNPAAPVQTPGANGAYTLTFPSDPTVTYSVTDANGITRTISPLDLGKPLPYSGTVSVSVKPSSSLYVVQPNSDGTPMSPWQFSPINPSVTPQAPQSHDRDGASEDTYVVPAQAGVLWTVDGVDLDPSEYGKEIATGGKLEMRFVARAASGYSLADDAENEFFLYWTDTPSTGGIGDPDISHTIRDNGYQADVEWSGPEDAEGVTYTVEFAKVTQDEDGDEVLGTLQTWKEDTEETGGRFSAGYGVTYKIYVTATDEHGTESETVSEYISFSEDPRGTESRWVDINRSTVTPSGNDALGWYQAGSSLYFNNTAFVTYRDQSNITFTVNGGQQLRVYGTQYTKGGRALIQVNGTNWAWLDAGASSNADPYKKMLRQINLPNTGTHTIKIIASLLPGKELALDAYEVVR